MTGFGSKSAEVPPCGKMSVELRSTNHKFLEIVFHLPEGFLSLEGKLRKLFETELKRGRITCVIDLRHVHSPKVSVNDVLLKNYISSLRAIKKKFKIEGELELESLIHLPGILSLSESNVSGEKIWPLLKKIAESALESLVKMRKKEGRALHDYLKRRIRILEEELKLVSERFKVACEAKTKALNTPDECSSFLKDADISEEISRLDFHINNFTAKLSKSEPVGKELDFIAQEMQREANTIGAKSCDSLLSARVIQIKSQIEKIREQVQNVE